MFPADPPRPSIEEGSSATELARWVVRSGIAPSAALGFAVRRGRGAWDIASGRTRAGSVEPFFDLASLTKPMTALAVARAKLDLSERLGELLEEARGSPAADATIELLLAHRAGLAPTTPCRGASLEPSGGRAEGIVRAAHARRPDAAGSTPAAGFAPVYSDVGYVLAGEALARVVGARDPGEAIEVLVVGPLGLGDELGSARALRARSVDFDARVEPTEVVAARGGEVRGAVHDENAWALTGDGASGHAGMFGTVRGVLAFAAGAADAILRSEGPLACGDLGWLVRPREGGSLRAGFDGKSEEGSSAGALAGPRTFGHLGFTGTSVWIDPEREAAIAALTNRVSPSRDNVAIRAARPLIHDALWALAGRGS